MQKRQNKIWELWEEGKAISPYAELMTYQNEINNGGHDQYFMNIENTRDLPKELSVLASVLPQELKSNVQKAYAAYLALAEDKKAEEVLKQCDDVFYDNEKEITRLLEDYAAKTAL